MSKGIKKDATGIQLNKALLEHQYHKQTHEEVENEEDRYVFWMFDDFVGSMFRRRDSVRGNKVAAEGDCRIGNL
jgi:hypothetical protein